MVSDATAYERGVNISQTGLIPNFREGVQANPWFQLGYQMGLKHGARAAGMMSRAKSEFPAVAARLQASRPGVPDTFAVEDKDEMAKHPSWSEGILGDKAAPSAVAYSWIDRNVPVSGRTHMLLADLTAGVHARNPSLSVQQAVLAAAKDMVQKGVATSDLRTFVEQGGRFSRPGAPDTFAVEDKDEMGTNKRIIRARGHEFLAEDEGNRTRISIKIDGVWEHATTVNTDNQTATEWIEANAKPGHPRQWLPYAFSRPGAPDTFAVEDRFYFGKGRKER